MKITVKKVEPTGRAAAFVTRSCCGPDGVGPCQAKDLGLACGVGFVNTYPEPTEGEERQGLQLRTLRRELGLTLGDVADRLNISVVTASELERGAANVDNWEELKAFLRNST